MGYGPEVNPKMTHRASLLLRELREDFPIDADRIHRDLCRMSPDDPFLERRVRSRLMLGRVTAKVPHDGLVQEILTMVEKGDFGATAPRPTPAIPAQAARGLWRRAIPAKE